MLALGGAVVAVALAGCSGTPSAAPVTVTVTATSDTGSAGPSASPTSASASPTTTAAVYPAGYDYAFVRAITQAGDQWVVVLDPVTMCHPTSTDPACAQVVKQDMPDDYAIVNVSTRLYTVPLAPGTLIERIGPSGQPTDYVTSPPAVASFSESPPSEFLAQVALNSSSQLTMVKQWWHP